MELGKGANEFAIWISQEGKIFKKLNPAREARRGKFLRFGHLRKGESLRK